MFFFIVYLGSLTEGFIGKIRFFIFVILCGLFQEAICEITIEPGAIGISGVVYGLFGILTQIKDSWAIIPDEKILPRIGFKMATGTGKTVVMAALILYHYFNRSEYRNDIRFKFLKHPTGTSGQRPS